MRLQTGDWKRGIKVDRLAAANLIVDELSVLGGGFDSGFSLGASSGVGLGSGLACDSGSASDASSGFAVAIVGATGTGKSEVAEIVAQQIGGEIVSADSMQIYKGMDIGTAKLPVDQRSVPYHCIDLVGPGESYSAALFQRDARRAISEIFARGNIPIVCGGTGLYVMAALDEMHFPAGEQSGNPLREHYEAIANGEGAEVLHRILEERDPESAKLIHPNNVRRVVRALEMLEEGKTYAEQASGFRKTQAHISAIYFGLRLERSLLYERINQRVDFMIDAGLEDEVRALTDAGFAEALTSSQAIGYKEMLAYLNGQCSLETAVEDIKRATRRYAKRQSTWFGRDSRIHWIDLS